MRVCMCVCVCVYVPPVAYTMVHGVHIWDTFIYILPFLCPPLHVFSDAFPVLVEIERSAFHDFTGRIQFTDSPFPALQSIGTKAFEACLSFESRVELTNQLDLTTLHEMVFRNYNGAVVLSGNLPKLEVLGFQAFQTLEKSQLHEGVPQVVDLEDLPSLKFIGKNVFENFLGNVTVRGKFPSLEFIGEEAFRNVRGSSVSFKLPFGAPALQCVGPRAFGSTQWGTQLETTAFVMIGDFPCLFAQDRAQGNTRTTFNAGDDIFNSLDGPHGVEFNMGVYQCKPGETKWCTETDAVCRSIHGFADDEYCKYINL